MADKLAIGIEPWWFFVIRSMLSGEINEYMNLVKTKYTGEPISDKSKRDWGRSVKRFLNSWAYDNRNNYLE